jgi:hypothetical protein
MRHVGTLYVNIAISLLLVPDNLTSRTFALHIAKESYGFAQFNQLRQVCKPLSTFYIHQCSKHRLVFCALYNILRHVSIHTIPIFD